MKGERFRDTFAGKGSALHDALINNDGRAATRIYNETTARFDALYPGAKDDRRWFENWNEADDLAKLKVAGLIEITAADAAMLVDLQENPRAPNEAMQRAFKRFQERA